MFGVAFGGFVDFLSEYGWDFLAISEEALDDPRLAALEDLELEAAGMRIENFCGIDNFFDAAPTSPDGSPPGGNGTVGGSDLPEDFPAELAPPGGDIVAVVNVGGATSVTFNLSTDTDDVIASYTEIVGAPVQALDEPKGALWVVSYEGLQLSLTIAEIGDNMVQINVTLL